MVDGITGKYLTLNNNQSRVLYISPFEVLNTDLYVHSYKRINV